MSEDERENLEAELAVKLKHTLKLVPSSQRELFLYELADAWLADRKERERAARLDELQNHMMDDYRLKDVENIWMLRNIARRVTALTNPQKPKQDNGLPKSKCCGATAWIGLQAPVTYECDSCHLECEIISQQPEDNHNATD